MQKKKNCFKSFSLSLFLKWILCVFIHMYKCVYSLYFIYNIFVMCMKVLALMKHVLEKENLSVCVCIYHIYNCLVFSSVCVCYIIVWSSTVCVYERERESLLIRKKIQSSSDKFVLCNKIFCSYVKWPWKNINCCLLHMYMFVELYLNIYVCWL